MQATASATAATSESVQYCQDACEADLVPCAAFLQEFVGVPASLACAFQFGATQATGCSASGEPEEQDQAVCPYPLVLVDKYVGVSLPTGYIGGIIPGTACSTRCPTTLVHGKPWRIYRSVAISMGTLGTVLSAIVFVQNVDWKRWKPNFVAILSAAWVLEGIIVVPFMCADFYDGVSCYDGEIGFAGAQRTTPVVVQSAALFAVFIFNTLWSAFIGLHLFCSVVLGKNRFWLSRFSNGATIVVPAITFIYTVTALSVGAIGNDVYVAPGIGLLVDLTVDFRSFDAFFISLGLICSGIIILCMLAVIAVVFKTFAFGTSLPAPRQAPRRGSMQESSKRTNWAPSVQLFSAASVEDEVVEDLGSPTVDSAGPSPKAVEIETSIAASSGPASPTATPTAAALALSSSQSSRDVESSRPNSWDAARSRKAWRTAFGYNIRTMGFLLVFGLWSMGEHIALHDTIYYFVPRIREELATFYTCLLADSAANPDALRADSHAALNNSCMGLFPVYRLSRHYSISLYLLSLGVVSSVLYATPRAWLTTARDFVVQALRRFGLCLEPAGVAAGQSPTAASNTGRVTSARHSSIHF
jgi:hypothetical protein